MKLIIDGLTAHSPAWERGIGKVCLNLWREVLFHHRHAEIVFTGFDDRVRGFLGRNLGNVTFHQIDRTLMSLPPGQRAAAYTAEIEGLRQPDQPTVFWHANPLMDDQILPYYLVMPTLLTVYDFIPLRWPDLYLDRWPRQQRDEYLQRLAFFRRANVTLAPISRTVARQVADMLPTASASTRAAPIGYETTLFFPDPLVRHQAAAARPYILLVSGDDPRKNIFGFVEAFLRWRRTAADVTSTLKIVCRISAKSRARIEALQQAHDGAGAVEVLGHVSDPELSRLVKGSALAAMPSLDEGFGLPILEAMACGVPVVASDIPTSHEIGGDLIAYFDPHSIGSMADCLGTAMAEVQAGVQGGRTDREALVRAAERFNWTRAGVAYRHLIAGLARPRTALPPQTRVAMLTPWPPQKSGIANSARTLAAALAAQMDLTVVVQTAVVQTAGGPGSSQDAPQEAPQEAPSGVRMIDAAAFDPDDFDLLICQMGNNTQFHSWIYDHCLSPKALVIAHDAYIHPFLQFGYREGVLKPQYLAMLRNHFSESRIEQFADEDFSGVSVLEQTGYSQIARMGARILFHGRYGHAATLREVPEARARLGVAHLAYGPTDHLDPGALAPLPDRFVLGMFGYMTRLKQPVEVLRAVQILIARGFPVELRIVGPLGDMETEIRAAIAGMVMSDEVRLIGFSDDTAFAAQMAACDLVINLRHPTLGESSGVVYEALWLGVPVVVTNDGSFAELPDDAVVKVAPSPHVHAELADRIAELLCAPDRRRALAEQGRLHIREAASLADYAGAVRHALAEIFLSLPQARGRTR